MCVDCVFPMHNSMLVINIIFSLAVLMTSFDYISLHFLSSFHNRMYIRLPVTLLNPIFKKKCPLLLTRDNRAQLSKEYVLIF